MARSKSGQTKHNAEVRKVARRLEKSGYDVQADIRGYDQPKTIGGFRPDAIGKKGSHRILVEVETPDSVGTARDQAQQRAFKRAADRAKGTTFRRVITK